MLVGISRAGFATVVESTARSRDFGVTAGVNERLPNEIAKLRVELSAHNPRRQA